MQQDPPMFRALVWLLSEKRWALRAVAFLALAPIREYIVGGSNAGQFPPAGGWEWLERITAQQDGDRIYYRVCGSAGTTRNGSAPVDLFCAGGDLVSKNPAQASRLTLHAAERGYVPAQEVVRMMYAIGKGVQQDYREAGKRFLTAAEAGNTQAAIKYVGSLRSGMGNLRRDPEFTERWAKFLIATRNTLRFPAGDGRRRRRFW